MKTSFIVAVVIAMISSSPVSAKSLAIQAKVVNENGSEQNWLVIDQDTGKIAAVAKNENEVPADCKKLKFDGYAFAGLIDTHNHLNWNSIRAWKPEKVYNNRQDWKDLKTGSYGTDVWANYQKMSESKDAPSPLFTSAKYSEIRAIVGGTTMIESSYSPEEEKAPPAVLARNLTRVPFKVVNETGEIMKLPEATLKKHMADMALPDDDNNQLNRLFLHIGEGKHGDAIGLAEFEFLRNNKLLNPHVAIIHGGALGKDQFTEMAKNNMGLSWSPRSNIALYKETTDIPAAIEAGVTVALSPDWTISGSNNALEEMKFAYDYANKNWTKNNPITPKRLYMMVTTDAAKVAGIEKDFGKLNRGFNGDLFLANTLAKDPFQSLLKTTPKDITLVVVEGKPVYGNSEVMTELGLTEVSEPIEIEGVSKRIIVKDNGKNKQDLKAIRSQLESVMTSEFLAPIIEQH
jgi:cytosine/adenosine deaminase-related metal-dependent hydrolase